jgi:hypothetical protein
MPGAAVVLTLAIAREYDDGGAHGGRTIGIALR